MSASTPIRCRDIEARYSSLQPSNNHESPAETSIDRAHASKSPVHASLREAELQRCRQDIRQLQLSSSPYGLRASSSKASVEPENNSASRHPHALELSASLKLALAQRLYPSGNEECDDNQSQTQHQQETQDKEVDADDGAEPHIDDEADGSGNQTQHNDAEPATALVDSSNHGEEDQGGDSGRRRSYACEPMVRYDEFLSVSKPSHQISRQFFATSSAEKPSRQLTGTKSNSRIEVDDARFQDCDDDIVNLCSPVTSTRDKKVIFSTLDTEDRPLSTTTVEKQEGGWKKGKVRDPKWALRQFDQYYELLGFLEHAFTPTNAAQVAISGAQLDEMERLLSSLLPSQPTAGGDASLSSSQMINVSGSSTSV